VITDPDLSHQIVINLYAGSGIYISCNCLAKKNFNGSLTHKPIAVRSLWTAEDALKAYRNWHAANGVALDRVAPPLFFEESSEIPR
jgi:hypothetical protein